MEEVNQIGQNKMGTMPVGRLLIAISMPMVISMLVQSLYNIVDSIFVARLGEEALTAVSLAFPIQNLMIAVASGTGVGFNALISRYLGERDPERANKVAQHGIFLTLLNGIPFILLGIFFINFFFNVQTSNAQVVDYGTDYMRIISIFSYGLFFQITFERLLQSTGKTHLSMIIQMIGAILNIILDPILIFGLLGLPAMGVAGAAIATVIGQTTAALIGLMICIKYNKELSINMRKFVPSKYIIGGIYRIGFPVIILLSIGSIMLFGINSIIIGVSISAAAVFGIFFRLQSFVFMPIFGLSNGLVSIVAYNYGARKKERILKTVKLAIIMAVSIMTFGTVVFWLFPTQLLGLFDATPEMVEIGAVALRVISLGFPIAGCCIVLSGGPFQAMGYSIYSLMTSVVRQLVVILPLAFIFVNLWGIEGVWLVFPISETVALVMTIIIYRKLYKKVIKNL